MNPYVYKFELSSVVDGDTVDGRIDLGYRLGWDVRVRLNHYDAAETYRPKSEAEREAGTRVAKFLEELLLGKELMLDSRKIDIYNRCDGDLFIKTEGGYQSANKMVMSFIEENHLEKARFRP